jgi:hypothetical protein
LPPKDELLAPVSVAGNAALVNPVERGHGTVKIFAGGRLAQLARSRDHFLGKLPEILVVGIWQFRLLQYAADGGDDGGFMQD